MPRLYRWITAMLAVCILINMIPVTAFAQDLTEDAALVEDLSLETSEPETTAATETVSEETESQEAETQATEPVENETQATESDETETAATQPEETEPEEDYPTALLDLTEPNLTDPFAAAFQEELKKDSTLNGKYILKEDSDNIELTVSDGKVLGVLAKMAPVTDNGTEYYYHNWIIRFSISGQTNLPNDFEGLGTETYPFEGTFAGNASIATEKTIFNWLSTKANLGNIGIDWSGTADKPILAEVLEADNASDVNMPLQSASTFSPYIGTLEGRSTVTLPKLNYSGADFSGDLYLSNAGILCGSMNSGSKLEIDAANLILPTEKVLTLNASGNVGSLVGSMDSNAELTISGGSSLTLNAKLTGDNVGGLVGYAKEGAKIHLNAPVIVSATINSTGSAGAIAGVVENGPLLDGTETVTVGAVNITASNAEDNGAGVLYGQYTTSVDYSLAHIAFGSGTRQVSGYNCGGIFGKLTLTEDAKCTVSESITTTLNTATNYGGIVGTLEGERKNALIVHDTTVTTNAASATTACMGGLVGIQNATLDTKKSTITLDIVTQQTKVTYFGGLSAEVGDGELLLADEICVSTNGYYADSASRGGGVAGSTGIGSIVYLKTSLDLSICALATKPNFGQVVGYQDCSLVYAPGVKISRLKTGSYNGMHLDDIGNYGQPYYIEDFLTLDSESYKTSLPTALVKSSDEAYELSKPMDYALLALAWQSQGAFATVSGITNSNWEDLQSSTIRLVDNIDLTGCGIGGLSRDVSGDTFSGTFDGQGNTLTLDIGHENNQNSTDSSKGDGRICTHNAVGLFAEMSGGAQVKNLTLAGNIRISNRAFADGSWNGGKEMNCGGLAAKLSTKDNPISNVSTKVKVDAQCDTNNKLYIGGLFGLVTKDVVTLTIDSEQGASITPYYYNNGSCNHIGGVIGAIEGSSNITVTCNGDAKLDGSITCTGSTANNYAGGLIGTILNGGTPTVNISKLAVDDFSFTGNATQRMGGILGCIWADTTVNIDGLTVTEATLKANGTNVELGGLVYRASGKWTVSSVDLSGLTVNASKAKALGLMVCKGGTFKEYLNNNSTPITMEGLYLVMSTPWETGYKVPEADTAIDCGSAIFDEFVAYTAYADPANSEPNYQITANGSGIISLTTTSGTVTMDGKSRNTYENRTKVSQKANLYSRYYYNLPQNVDAYDGRIDTKQRLLLWSVNRYASDNLKKYFPVTGSILGGSSDSDIVDFDMEGLSYYPVSLTNSSITVQYAKVAFHNSEIENQEAMGDGNKLTRGTPTSHSQHYTMHCGLFLDFTADVKNETPNSELTLKVNGVSFAGTVGVVNGKSGALVCGTVAGESVDTKTSVCKVILAEEAEEDNKDYAVTLDGISVEPSEAGTRPVLIGSMGDYVSLEANYLDYTANQLSKKACGTSLIGDVGGTNAVSVKVDLKGTIKLPDQKRDGVFTATGATLFNSLQFKNGSATYVFYKAQEYPDDTYTHNATYGLELSADKSVEYPGKEGCYNDGYGKGNFISKNGLFEEQMDFSSYLPYVRFSPATSPDEHGLASGYHELAVNVLFMAVTAGCGTYGDPYRITSGDAGMLNDIARYINTGKAPDKWEVTLPGSQGYHINNDSSGDITLHFDGTTWRNGTDEYQGDVQKHLASAYYCFEKDVELSGFSGFGANAPGGLPFTGVITGKQLAENRYPTVTLSGSNGLINYSYGSVVRDLNVNWTQSVSLTRGDWSPGSAEDAPKTFFGGVIGCVLGGDNIIENVDVTVAGVETTGTDHHLVPVGGYVGVIAGGGVLFRGNISDSTGISGTDSHLFYTNPIVGRVLGGYAFYEGENGTNTAPNNTDKNYTINTITAGTHLAWDGSTLTIKDGEGLLLLSAIVSSGAGSYGSSLAYRDGYGVARVAKYDNIGEDEAAARDDYVLTANTATPYLLSSKFLEGTASQICKSGDQSGITLKLGDGPFNMGDYGNGYRGLSARYVSNASYTIKNDGTKQMSPYTVVMRIKSFDGNNKTVNGINMDVKEYDDDDFHAASVGGIFNILWTNLNTGGGSSNTNNTASQYDSVLAKNLTIRDCTVKLAYYDTVDNNPKPQAKYDYFTQADGISTVSVGGFIGTVNNLSDTGMGDTASNYLFKNIRVDANGRSTIYGPNSAGAIIGASGMGSNGYPGSLLTNGRAATSVRFGPSFLNCSYKNTDVTGYLAAGGMVGCAATGYNILVSFGTAQDGVASGCFATCTITDENLIFAEDSTIQTRSSGGICGGVFGGIGMRGRINEPDIYAPETENAKPMVNYLTGLSILDNVENIQTLCLKGVNLYARLDFADHIYYAKGVKNGVDNGGTIAVGGCIGRISHANPVRIYQVAFGEKGGQRSEIKAQNPGAGKVSSGNRYAGGLIGYGYTTREMTIDNCGVYCTDIFGTRSGGLIARSGFNALNISNSAVEGCVIDTQTSAGGLTGCFWDSDCSVKLFNILIKNTSVKNSNGITGCGRLFGVTTSGKVISISAVGVSVFCENAGYKLPTQDRAGYDTISNGSFLVYADYAGTETPVDSYEAPYVVANPNYTLNDTKRLTGDAVGIRENAGTIGALIWKENQTDAARTINYAPYGNIGTTVNGYVVVDLVNGDADSTDASKTKLEISTFNAVQGCGPDTLPVLLLKDGNTTVITDYLDVITNGGYSNAGTAVSLSVSVYYWDEVSGGFIPAGDKLEDEPQSIVLQNNALKVNVKSYDNQRARFTLVEATFSMTINGTQKIYTVSIPVVVVRELQFVYNATLSYDKEFKTEEYPRLTNHLLESTGTPFTAYLTYQYNRAHDGNYALTYAEYDWQGYMDGKGDMLGVNKKLIFKGGPLPVNTELILLDCQNGNRAYSYTVTGSSCESLLLSSFRALDDGTTPFRSSMAETLKVERTQVDAGKGKYVEITGEDTSRATVRLKNGDGSFAYYRLAEGEEMGTYNLTVPDLDGWSPIENYLLVVNIPKQGNDFSISGKLQSELVWVNPSRGTKLLRGNTKDDEQNTVSTYQISSGYAQNLVSLDKSEAGAIDLMDSTKNMKVQIQDTITFDPDQVYNPEDNLFLKFSVGLRKIIGVEGEDVLFPQGTDGIVKFYVQADGQYFYYENGKWNRGTTGKPEAVSNGYKWMWNPKRGSMNDLLLSEDGETPLSLAQVRDAVKNNSSEIIVTAEMDIIMDETLLRAVVPTSEKQGVDNYVCLQYRSQLSTTAQGLDYSTARDYAPKNETNSQRYYLGVTSEAVLSMDATDISQLGVNPLAPIPEYLTEDGKSKIECVISLNLENLQNLDRLLASTQSVTYQLALYKRAGDGYTSEVVDGRSNYISFLWPDDSQEWEWTIEPTVGEYFNGKQFTIPLTAKVSMNVADYANYKVGVKVVFNGTEEVKVPPDNAYIVYTYACIRPSFYAGS